MEKTIDNIRNRFQMASKTGTKVFILKAIEICDCYNENSLVNSEPDPFCKKCLGTGNNRLIIQTEKIRFDYTGSSDSLKSAKSVIENIENKVLFYFSEIYKTLNNKDIIIIPNGEKEYKCYEIENNFINTYNDFNYSEVSAKKIPFLNLWGVLDEFNK